MEHFALANPYNSNFIIGNTIIAGQSLKSNNLLYILIVRKDCNLVLYNSMGNIIWQTNTANGVTHCYLTFTSSNQLCLTNSNTVVWRTTTNKNINCGPKTRLTLFDSGILTLFDSTNNDLLYYNPIWTTGFVSNQLTYDQNLESGSYLQSLSSEFVFMLQEDGNLVIYDTWFKTVKWSSDTSGQGQAPYNLYLNSNTVLSYYDKNNNVVYTFPIFFSPIAILVMQSDGNLVIYSGTSVLWSSNTGNCVATAVSSYTVIPNGFISLSNCPSGWMPNHCTENGVSYCCCFYFEDN